MLVTLIIQKIKHVGRAKRLKDVKTVNKAFIGSWL